MGICVTSPTMAFDGKMKKAKSVEFSDSSSSISSLGDLEDIADPQMDYNIRGMIEREVEDAQKISIFINGQEHRVEPGLTIYEASLGVLGDQEKIPTENGTLVRACRTSVYDGLKIKTNSYKVEDNITSILRKKLSQHILGCPSCPVQGNCYFEKLLQRFGVSIQDLDETERQAYFKKQTEMLIKSPDEYLIQNESLIYDPSKCLTCYRCVRVCQYIQGMSKSSLVETDAQAGDTVRVFKDLEDYHENMFASDCIRCGMCSFVCPVGAITEKSQAPQIQRIIRDKSRSGNVIVCQVAPSVRVTISETFGLPPGQIHEEVLVSCLKDVGFDYVFDTSFGADLCVMEESRELIDRIQKGGPFPMFTSCCPGWINLVEKHFPKYVPNVSTCKSPQAMLGKIIKTYWAEKMGIEREKIVVVSIMPCVAKKSEISRPDIVKDVDFTMTTREIGRYIRKSGMNFMQKKRVPFDHPLGSSSSSAVIFGASGGVMEAALRTTYELMTGNPFPTPVFKQIRGLRGLKMSITKINEQRLKIAVCSGGSNIRKFIQKLRYETEQSMGGGNSTPYFVEVMACPGGCLGGGGNPKFERTELLRKRTEALHRYDELPKEMKKEEKNNPKEKEEEEEKREEHRSFRKSHENPDVKKLYADFLKSPGSQIARKLLHTSYQNRKNEDNINENNEEEL